MSTKKDFYLAVKNELLKPKDEIPSVVKHSALFNNQFVNIDKEVPFLFPAVFIQFLELDYSSRGDQIQDAAAIIRLHVGYESIKTDDIAVFDLLEEVHKKMQGFGLGEGFTPLDRTYEEQDVDHDNISVWMVDYTTKITDNSASAVRKLVKTTLSELDVDISSAKPWLKQN